MHLEPRTGHTRGASVIPWKHAFEDEADRYRSRRRNNDERAAEEERSMKAIAEQVESRVTARF